MQKQYVHHKQAKTRRTRRQEAVSRLAKVVFGIGIIVATLAMLPYAILSLNLS